ncbi:MAG TPA: PEGA domain-containing protein [Blastocatellia bacterium]|nr:PEGA domain-containing protein [Blastocatellia bacterium]
MNSNDKQQIRRVRCFVATLAILAFGACGQTATNQNRNASDSTARNNAASTNAASTNSNRNTSAKSAANAAPAASSKSASGSIEVTSVPSGARVLLIVVDESGASEPQSHGVTPTTITNLGPGQYTIDIEMPGYRYYQTKVDLKENATAKVRAVLKK